MTGDLSAPEECSEQGWHDLRYLLKGLMQPAWLQQMVTTDSKTPWSTVLCKVQMGCIWFGINPASRAIWQYICRVRAIRTSYNVHGTGQAAQRQVGADKDGSWRQDGMAPVADREQQRPQLQQQEGTRGGPRACIAFLRISPKHELMHTCLAHDCQEPGRCSRNWNAPAASHTVTDVGGINPIASASQYG